MHEVHLLSSIGAVWDSTVASQNDWGPLDILILGALHHELCHINVGLNTRPEGMTALLHIIIRQADEVGRLKLYCCPF